MITQSRNSYVEANLHAPTIGELCKQLEDDDGTYQTHMDGRLQNLLKEAREKSKYWISCSSSDNTELYCKKVGIVWKKIINTIIGNLLLKNKLLLR